MRLAWSWSAAALVTASLVGCAPTGGGDAPKGVAGAGGAAGAAGAGGAGGGAAGEGGDGATGFDTSPPDAKPDPDAACASVIEKANATPLNLYVMLDKSSSMDGTNWTAAKAGLEAFVKDPAQAGVRVALNFFPDSTVQPPCDQKGYKTPKVPFGALPGSAAPILAALAAQKPDGFGTPVWPALGGAILACIEASNAQPGDTSAVLLVTDGEPQGPAPQCSGVNPEDPAEVAKLAKTGADYTPPVKTFVIGLPGVVLSKANVVAAAGGTGQAIVVSAANPQAEFQKALAQAKGQALPCEFTIPTKVSGGEIALDKVNVVYTKGGTSTWEYVYQTSDCAKGGWYYDDPKKPTKVILCPSTCQTIKSDFQAKIEILLGCQTQVVK